MESKSIPQLLWTCFQTINVIYIILSIKYEASSTFQKLSREVSSFHFSGYEKLRKWAK